MRNVVDGRWTPWLAWLTSAYDELPGRRPSIEELDPIAMWRRVRDQVLLTLDELGLEATVHRTDDPLPIALEEHLADLAGLVHVHRPGGDFLYSPTISSSRLLGRSQEDRHALAMIEEHGLLPAGQHLPIRFRAFCGQFGDVEADLLGTSSRWRDHIRAWVTLYGDPVLSVEPTGSYLDDPAELVQDLLSDIAANGLPLMVTGPYPGIWSDTSTLALIRHDTNGSVCLPALRTAPGLWLNQQRHATPSVREHNAKVSITHSWAHLAGTLGVL